MLLIEICWLSDRDVETGKMGICRSCEYREVMLEVSQYMAEICGNMGLYHGSGLTGCMHGCQK